MVNLSVKTAYRKDTKETAEVKESRAARRRNRERAREAVGAERNIQLVREAQGREGHAGPAPAPQPLIPMVPAAERAEPAPAPQPQLPMVPAAASVTSGQVTSQYFKVPAISGSGGGGGRGGEDAVTASTKRMHDELSTDEEDRKMPAIDDRNNGGKRKHDEVSADEEDRKMPAMDKSNGGRHATGTQVSTDEADRKMPAMDKSNGGNHDGKDRKMPAMDKNNGSSTSAGDLLDPITTGVSSEEVTVRKMPARQPPIPTVAAAATATARLPGEATNEATVRASWKGGKPSGDILDKHNTKDSTKKQQQLDGFHRSFLAAHVLENGDAALGLYHIEIGYESFQQVAPFKLLLKSNALSNDDLRKCWQVGLEAFNYPYGYGYKSVNFMEFVVVGIAVGQVLAGKGRPPICPMSWPSQEELLVVKPYEYEYDVDEEYCESEEYYSEVINYKLGFITEDAFVGFDRDY